MNYYEKQTVRLNHRYDSFDEPSDETPPLKNFGTILVTLRNGVTSIPEELNLKGSPDLTECRPKRKESDYMLATFKKDIIWPDIMRQRPKYRLKEICDENSYEISIKDFSDQQHLIGKGTFGEVYVTRWLLNDWKYAVKILDKALIKKKGFDKYLLREKEILNSLDHPNIIRLESYFNDSKNWYFCFEFWDVGDLNTFIKDHKKLSTELTREFTMEIILALEYLQNKKIVHRDLKPQNILIDDTFHIKLADLGGAKQIDPEETRKLLSKWDFSMNRDDFDDFDDFEDCDSEVNSGIIKDTVLTRTETQIGSPLYISPEMLKYQIANFGSDLWALGWIIYQCLIGKPLFSGENKFEIEDNIWNWDFELPEGLNKDAKDLISKLLHLNPLERLGAGIDWEKNSMQALKSHPFFAGHSFDKWHRTIPSLHTLKRKVRLEKYKSKCKHQLLKKDSSLFSSEIVDVGKKKSVRFRKTESCNYASDNESSVDSDSSEVNRNTKDTDNEMCTPA